MRERERPVWLPNQSARDWREDATHENGNYQNLCVTCCRMFYGHKRRTVCRECADTPPAAARGDSEETRT